MNLRVIIRQVSPILFLIPTALFAAPGDIDNDGLRDAVETKTGVFGSAEDTGTDPNLADSDGDSLPDGMEVRLGTNPTSAASKVKRPNIILINCDDLGYGDIGCFWQNQRTGTNKFATPNLDEMAAQGAMMTHHYVGAPICAPSRASLMQGRHQGHSDIRDRMFDVALPNNHSIASILKASGYQTVHVGKAGLTGSSGATGNPLPANPLFRGFNRFFGIPFHTWCHEHYPRNGTTSYGSFIYDDNQKITAAYQDLYSSDAWTGFAKKTIIEETTSNPNRPFFLYVAYDTPHFIAQVPPTRDYPAGRGLSGGIQWTGAPSYVNTAVNEAARIDNTANMHPSVDPTWPVLHQKYVTMIRRLDDSVADILQTLRDLNIADNTLVIFTSDNGPDSSELDPQFFQSYAGFEGMKQYIYEGGIRVPTIVWWPGKIPASNQPTNIRRIANPSANYDWLATFAEMALAPVPSYTDGASLLPDLTGQGSRNAKDYLYFEFWTGGYANNWPDWPNHRNEALHQMQAIRIGDFMGVRTNIAFATDPFRIYNVVTDPKQGINLAASRPDLQDRMKYLSIAARRPTEAATVPSANRPYDNAPIPAQSARPVRNGLKWKAYEGCWPWLPEFRNLAPVASGNATGLTTSVLTRGNDAGATFEAYISVPTTGAYTFQLAANSNCNLWIDEAHVIDNDYNFTTTKSATKLIYLTAGLHPIRIYYRHQTGTPQLQLNWSGPGFSMQPVPATSYFVDGQPTVLQADTLSTTRETPITVNVLANDTAQNSLALQSVGSPQVGSADIIDGKARYTPAPGYLGLDQFSYSVNDGISLVSSSVSAIVLFDNEIWLPLDEGTGTSVNAYGVPSPVTGGLSGAADPAQSWTTGKLGKALRFDGVDDQVVFPSLPLPAAGSLRTFSCWIKTSNTSLDENQTIFTYGPASGGQRFTVRLAGTSAGSLVAAVEISTGTAGGELPGTAVGTKALNDGLWHHLTLVNAVADIAQTKIYVDGQPDTVSSSNPGILDTTLGASACLGGSDQSAACNFNGSLDDVRIFPRALSGSEVQALRSNTIATGIMTGTPPNDSDGDGIPDPAEEVAGTNPNDPASFFKIQSSNFTGSGISLQWAGMAGRSYRVEESTNLQDWTLVPGVAPVVVTSAQPAATVTIPANGANKRFLRIQVMQTP